jgi:tRNA dimethylallyltransferase
MDPLGGACEVAGLCARRENVGKQSGVQRRTGRLVMMALSDVLREIDKERPVLIAGPTASGKSALATEVADLLGGTIVNADALQVYSNWRILTARPSLQDEARIPHSLFGHVRRDQPYSVGQWLRELEPLLESGPLVIVGGTGLYFTALTEGLVDIPQTSKEVRAEADARLSEGGADSLLLELDVRTASQIDRQNPVRIQRAWEVLRTTGRGLAEWQNDTGPAMLAIHKVQPLVLDAPKDWLNPRIEMRLKQMLDQGVMDEVRSNVPGWRDTLPSAKAIGACELIAHANGELSLDEARTAIVTLTRQYAKRQRSWFRSRMKNWRWIASD